MPWGFRGENDDPHLGIRKGFGEEAASEVALKPGKIGAREMVCALLTEILDKPWCQLSQWHWRDPRTVQTLGLRGSWSDTFIWSTLRTYRDTAVNKVDMYKEGITPLHSLTNLGMCSLSLAQCGNLPTLGQPSRPGGENCR